LITPALQDTIIPETKPLSISAKWLPPDMADTKAYSFRFTRGERKILRKRKPMPVSLWAEKHRVLTISSVPGKWKNSTTPYLAGIMDASFFPSVHTIIVCAAPQTGKSEAVNTCIGYAIDRKPGSVLYVYPDEQTARENSKDRIQPMLTASRRLKSYMTGYDDDTSFLRINLQHLKIYMGWARSASRLANKPLPYVVLDEVDKYPETAGKKEGSPIALAEKRTRTYRSMRKIWKISTPTIETAPIWMALTTEAEVIFDFWVQCPSCGARQKMTFEQIKWPADERDPKIIEAKDLAGYECTACQARWDDDLRNRAVRRGEWRSRADNLSLMVYLQSRKPKKIGFHLPSWLSFFVGLSEVAARFLQGQSDKTALKDFMNADKAEPWVEYHAERKEDVILALKDDRPRGRVPGGGVVACLLAGVDTQDDGFYYEIRAFGFGMEKESWCIREGKTPTFEALARILWQDEYTDADGNTYAVMLTIQDALGHRTAEVYDFCRLHRGKILPSFGKQTMAQPHTWTNLEYYPGKKKPIPGGLKAVNVNTQYYKNALAGILEIAPADPGAWHYHSETTEDWARMMTVECTDERGIWVNPKGRANHGWDCSVYALAAHDVLGVRFWPKPSEKKKPTKHSTNDSKPLVQDRIINPWHNRKRR
jgi:phage terminase large subunit GpA-like protein